jgi:hypothetical protein
MKLIRKAGSSGHIFQLFIQDSSSLVGAGLAGLAFNTAALTAYYHRNTDTTTTAISLVTMTVGSYTSGGFKEIDSTNMPGWYQFCPPDAAVAVGANSCGFHIAGAANMAPCPFELDMVAYDPFDTTRLGLLALPNVVSGSAGAIPTTGTGANQIAVASGQVLLQTGTGAGQLDFTTGVIKSNTTQWLSTAVHAVNVNGVPVVDIGYLLGTAWLTPLIAGTPDVNTRLAGGTAWGSGAITAGSVAAGALTAIGGGVWDISIASHLTGGTTGNALNSAGAAGDPWSTVIPGAYSAGTAGHIVGRLPDVAVGAAGGLFIAGTNAATTITTALTTTFTGSLTGSVNSVTGLTASNLDAAISTRATPAQILTTALTENYPALHAAPTLTGILCEIRGMVTEKAVVGTTLSIKGFDGTTVKETYTLNDATAPTAITRAT